MRSLYDFGFHLMAFYCARPRDYLGDTPIVRAMGFPVSQHGYLGAMPPPPFSERLPFGGHVDVEVRYPLTKGYLSDTCTIAYETKAKRMRYPLCHTILKLSRSGGIRRASSQLYSVSARCEPDFHHTCSRCQVMVLKISDLLVTSMSNGIAMKL